MIGEIRQNFTEASASVGLILATALHYGLCENGQCRFSSIHVHMYAETFMGKIKHAS